MKLRLLLVEDNELLGQMQKEYLESNKFQVDWCQSLKQVQEYDLSQYLAILSDINLPDGSGLEIFEKVKADNVLVPVILQTGDTNPEFIIDGYHLGALTLLQKPFKMQDVLIKIHQYEYLQTLAASSVEKAQKAQEYFEFPKLF